MFKFLKYTHNIHLILLSNEIMKNSPIKRDGYSPLQMFKFHYLSTHCNTRVLSKCINVTQNTHPVV